MTSVSVLYFKEIDCDMATPPDSLIELFTEWISENPNLCSETQPPLELLSGAIPMPLIPPIEGLIRWCTLSPLFLPLNDLIYSKLHYAVLQSLTQVRLNTNRHILHELKKFNFFYLKANQNNATPTNALALGTIIDSVRNQADRYRLQNIDPDTDERMQICLERFAQSIQLGIMSRIITGSIPQLLQRLQTLPKNALLKMVLQNQNDVYL